MEEHEKGIIKLVQEKDETGRTVFRPLRKTDQQALEVGLKNPKGIRIDEPLDVVKECPVDTDLPYGLSWCAIQGDVDEDSVQVRKSARRKWLQGKKDEAMRILTSLDEAAEAPSESNISE